MDVTPIPKPKTFRSESYRNLVRSKGCLVCGAMAEPHHMSLHDARWGGKSSDLGAIPLCRTHHDLFQDHPKDFGKLVEWEQVWECMYWLEREWIESRHRGER